MPLIALAKYILWDMPEFSPGILPTSERKSRSAIRFLIFHIKNASQQYLMLAFSSSSQLRHFSTYHFARRDDISAMITPCDASHDTYADRKAASFRVTSAAASHTTHQKYSWVVDTIFPSSTRVSRLVAYARTSFTGAVAHRPIDTASFIINVDGP